MAEIKIIRPDNVPEPLTDNDLWEGMSGASVEDYIKSKLENLDKQVITEVKYDGNVLHIHKADGTTIDESVSVITPTYYANIWCGKIYCTYIEDSSEKRMQVTENSIINLQTLKKVEIEFVLTNVIQQAERLITSKAPVGVLFKFGANQKVVNISSVDVDKFEISNSLLTKLEEVIPTVDITSLFTKAQKGSILISTEVVSDTILTTPEFNVVNPEVIYSTKDGQGLNNYILNSNSIDFQITGTGGKSFELQISNNTKPFESSSTNYTKLEQGVNKLAVRAYCLDNPSIVSQWLHYDVIFSDNGKYKGTECVINEIAEKIDNGAVSNIFRFDAYNADITKQVNIKAYLEDTSDFDNLSALTPIKDETFNRSDFKDNLLVKQYISKYILIPNEGTKILKVYVNDKEYSKVTEFFLLSTFGDAGSWIFNENQNTWEILVPKAETEFLPVSRVSPIFSITQANIENNLIINEETLIPELNVKSLRRTINGKTCFQFAPTTKPIFKSGYFDLSLGANDFTLEFELESYDVSSEDSTIIKLGNLAIKSNEICWDIDYLSSTLNTKEKENNRETYLTRNSFFRSDVPTHITITLQRNFTLSETDPYYPDYLMEYADEFKTKYKSVLFSLLNVYINGTIDRLMILTLADVDSIGSQLIIYPKTSSFRLYGLKVFQGTPLTEAEVRQEYIASLLDNTSKHNIFDKNDIVDVNGTISLHKCLKKYNTLVYVFPKGFNPPNRAFGEKNYAESIPNDKALGKQKCTVFVNYADDNVNKLFGGKLTNCSLKAQGTSAKLYFIWNVLTKLGEFEDTPSQFINYSETNYDSATLKFKESPVAKLTNCYLLPNLNSDYITLDSTSSTDGFKVTKLVGKVNYASSMQSHKMGACNMYNDYYNIVVGDANHANERKAVKELPYLYFYLTTDLVDVSNVNLSDCFEVVDDEIVDKAKFLGVQTWGSGKADKPSFNIKSRKDYVLMEGAQNGDLFTNFMAPWAGLLRYADGKLQQVPVNGAGTEEVDVLNNLRIAGESIWSVLDQENPAWDISVGMEDDKVTIKESCKPSVKFFAKFYDFIYKWDCTIKFINSWNNKDNWDKNFKYCVTNSTTGSFTNHIAYDIYRFDTVTGAWVPAGLSYNNGWSRLNAKTDFEQTISGTLTELQFLNIVRTYYLLHLSEYLNVDDLSYHQAMIKLLSGTDNRAKNTYLAIHSVPNGDDTKLLISFKQDDLDTIFITDNQGKQSKAYNLLEPSYRYEDRNQWGDKGLNILFRCFDVVYENNIRSALTKIFQGNNGTVGIGTNPDDPNSGFLKYFYSIQEYFPSVVYNHTAKIYYELGLIFMDSKAMGDLYDGNGEKPLTLSHGSSLEGEKYFLHKRIAFLASYAKAGVRTLDVVLPGNNQTVKLGLKYSLCLDLYPIGIFGNITEYLLKKKDSSDITPEATYYIVSKDDLKQYDKVSTTSAAEGQGLMFTDYYSTLELRGFAHQTFKGSFLRLLELTITDNQARFDGTNEHEYGTFNNGTWESNVSLGEFAPTCPVLKKLTLNNIMLPQKLDLSGYDKLEYVNLSGVKNVKEVVLPENIYLHTLILPETIETLSITNNPNISTLTFEGYTNLNKVTLLNCPKLNMSTIVDKLTNVTELVLDLAINIKESSLLKLYTIPELYISKGINVVEDAYLSTTEPEKHLKEISFSNAILLYRNPTFLVNYKRTTITSALILQTITVSGEYDLLNALNNVRGNDILSTTFTFIKTSGGGLFDSKNWIIKKDDNVDRATLSFKVNASTTSATTFYVSYEKHIAQVGDFAYADGTFNDIYESSKDLMGLVYAVNGDLAYVIGKEYVSAGGTTNLYGGFDTSSDLYDMNNSLDVNLIKKLLIDESSYINSVQIDADNTNDVSNDFSGGNLNSTTFKGLTLTLNIINAINDNIVKCTRAGFNYAPTSIYDDRFSQNISDDGVDGRNLLIAPYYYATYLYEPKHPNTKDENFCELYKSTNWYVPDIRLYAQVLRQRACSSTSASFSTSDLYNSLIRTDAKSYNGVEPIFSMALNRRCPTNTAWTQLASNLFNLNCLLTSSIAQNRMNCCSYAFSSTTSLLMSYGSRGSYTWNEDANNRVWCGWRHLSIPFVTIDQSKITSDDN